MGTLLTPFHCTVTILIGLSMGCPTLDARADGDGCDAASGFPELELLMRDTQVQLAHDEQIADFCRDNQSEDVPEFWFNTPSNELRRLMARRSFPENWDGRHHGHAWPFTLFPDERIQILGLRAGMESLLYSMEEPFPPTAQEALNSNDPQVLSRFFRSPPSGIRAASVSAPVSTMQVTHSDQMPGGLTRNALCAPYGLLEARACARSLNDMLNWMSPRGAISLRPVVENVLSQPIHREGAREAAALVLDRLARPSDTSRDLLSDITQAYRTVIRRRSPNLSAAELESRATEHAWELLAVYSTRGANMIPELSVAMGNSANLVTIGALQAIASSIAVLDTRYAKSGRAYSLPPQVRSSCGYTKPYHFWMTAYLSRRAARSGTPRDAAMHAAWLAELGYQMLKSGPGSGRETSRPFRVGCMDPSNNKIRIDLAHAAAGAFYGSRLGAREAPPSADVDGALRSLLADRVCQERRNEADAQALWTDYNGIRGYAYWNLIFSPNSALTHLKREPTR